MSKYEDISAIDNMIRSSTTNNEASDDIDEDLFSSGNTKEEAFDDVNGALFSRVNANDEDLDHIYGALFTRINAVSTHQEACDNVDGALFSRISANVESPDPVYANINTFDNSNGVIFYKTPSDNVMTSLLKANSEIQLRSSARCNQTNEDIAFDETYEGTLMTCEDEGDGKEQRPVEDGTLQILGRSRSTKTRPRSYMDLVKFKNSYPVIFFESDYVPDSTSIFTSHKADAEHVEGSFAMDMIIASSSKTLNIPGSNNASTHMTERLRSSLCKKCSETDIEQPSANCNAISSQYCFTSDKGARRNENIKWRLCKALTLPLLSLFVFIADIGTDINMALSYKKDKHINEFRITVACIVIPLLIMTVVDVSLVWFDRGKRGKANCLRYLLGVLSFGRVYRGIEYMYHMYMSKTQREKVEFHREKARDEKRDCCMLDFIGGFAESVPQLFVQLYLYYSKTLDLSLGRVWSLSSSLISIAWTYSAYYRSNKEAIHRQQNVSFLGFLLLFLSVVASLSARVICIVLFLVNFNIWIGISILIGHFIAMFVWIALWQMPLLEGLTTKIYVRVLYYVFFAYVSMICFINLKNTPARWRIMFFYGIVYAENLIMAVLLHRQKPGDDVTEMVYVLSLGWLGHIVFLSLYYSILHPKTGLCYTCTESNSDSFSNQVGAVADLDTWRP